MNGMMLLAAATIAVNSVSQNATTRTVTVNYTLSGEPAVVTMGSVSTNGAAMAASNYLNVAGDANRLVGVGSHALLWQPPVEAGFGPFDANAVEVSLQAWATNAPPDYMVIDLEFPERVRYYTCAEAIPGGVGDVRYKTDALVMRRIPAAGVTWRMGSLTSVLPGSGWTDANRQKEATHYVKLTEDFYLAIYPTTYRQMYWLNNKATPADSFASFGGDWDWPMVHYQFCELRGWFHQRGYEGTDTCAYLKELVEAGKDPYKDDAKHKFWPRDGREIDEANTVRCNCLNYSPGEKYTSRLRAMRDAYGLKFDLPTEAQWEFACRAGSEKSIYTGYDLSDNTADAHVDEVAWNRNNSSNATYNCCLPHPVGLKPCNAYGLYDMLGNVSEYCVDMYANYPNDAAVHVDPVGRENQPNIRVSSANHVVRGGAFDGTAQRNRVNVRASADIGNNGSSPVFSDDSNGAAKTLSHGFRLWLPCHAAK